MKTVLVGVDFAESSLSAIAHAGRLSHALGARLHALYVIEPLLADDLADAIHAPPDTIGADVIAALEARLGRECAAAGVEADVRVSVGSPLRETLAAANALHAGLIVLGRNGRTPPERGPGSLAMHVTRQASSNVLLTPAGAATSFRLVGAAVDFSDNSRVALAEASRVAKADGASLLVVHAFDPPWDRLHYRAPTPEASPAFRESFLRDLDAHFERFIARAAPGVPAQRRLLEGGSSGIAVVDELSRAGADLIVVGTRGRTRLTSILLGSVAERIIREARCAVLAVKPPGFHYELV